MSDDANVTQWKDARTELLKRQLSNAENYDKAILTLSSAALGLSIGFLKDSFQLSYASNAWALYSSWYVLIGSIVLTIVSYQVSQFAIAKDLKRLYPFYFENTKDNEAPPTTAAKLVEILNGCSGLFFIVGIILTTFFVQTNIGVSEMNTITREENLRNIRNGASLPSLQRAPVEKGAPVPDLQKVPPNAPVQPPATQPAQPAQPETTTTQK
jgi:hypothetical protein